MTSPGPDAPLQARKHTRKHGSIVGRLSFRSNLRWKDFHRGDIGESTLPGPVNAVGEPPARWPDLGLAISGECRSCSLGDSELRLRWWPLLAAAAWKCALGLRSRSWGQLARACPWCDWDCALKWPLLGDVMDSAGGRC